MRIVHATKQPASPSTALRYFLPGLLVAATGVGAGDLATASLVGAKAGVAVLWAVIVGAILKFAVNEGVARWQLATGTTLLEGCCTHLGRPFQIAFAAYLLPWSFFVGAALVSACGVTMHAILSVFDDPNSGRIGFGIAHSFLGLALVRIGGYRVFARVMSACIGVMFASVLVAAWMQPVPRSEIVSAVLLPTVPTGGLKESVTLMGGVGGTLTILCYGYWIREEGRSGLPAVRICRWDLAAAYAMTAIFGIGMVIIGSQIQVEGKGAGLIVALAARMETALGPAGKWIFLIGAYGAVFSSLLGVWQAVPYIYADFFSMVRGDPPGLRAARVSQHSTLYRACAWALAVVPLLGLFVEFETMQRRYSYFGAFFMPFLAVALLYLNGREHLVGKAFRNGPLITALLLLTLAFFAYAAMTGAAE